VIAPSIVALSIPSDTGFALDRMERSRFGRLQSVALFLCGLTAYSGSLKEVPPLSLSPADLTLVTTLGAAGLGLLFTMLVGSMPPRRPTGVLLLLLTVAAVGSILAVPTGYGLEKTTRIFIVTLPAVLGVLLAVRNHLDAYRFTRMMVVLAIVQSIYINIEGERQFGFGRLVTQEGTTISFGRAAGYVVIAAAAWLMSSRRVSPTKVMLALAVAAFHVWTVFAIASRGPILGLGVGLLAMLVLQLRRIRIQTGVRLVFLSAVMTTAMMIVWFQIPAASRDRLVLFGADGSTNSRTEAWEFTWQQLTGSLIGQGWGSWDVVSPVRIVYPHNLFLEMWFEAGLIGLIAISAAVWIPIRNQDHIFKYDRFRGTFGLGGLIYWLMTSLVSGDFNDNKVLFVLLIAGAAPIVLPRSGTDGDPAATGNEEHSMSLAELVAASDQAHAMAREAGRADDLVGAGVGPEGSPAPPSGQEGGE
jgi:O-antigen ligase